MGIVVIGATGQLGHDLMGTLPDRHKVVGLSHAQLVIEDMESLTKELDRLNPSVVINSAGFTNVEKCEIHIGKSFLINALGVHNVALYCREHGSLLLHLSTDFVFDGNQESPYNEQDIPNPVNAYGVSKLAGECFVRYLLDKYFIVRTSSLFGVAGSRDKGGNFVDKILALARKQQEIQVVSDLVFSPTYSRDLAKKIAELLRTNNYGIFHITNSGTCSWYEFAKEILRLSGLKTPVVPITSAQYPQKARRPRNSVLDNRHLRQAGIGGMRPWQEALEDYLKEKGHLRQ